ncbi:TPA: O-antigen ligase RfaL [Salmonella enterica subsp. enterica serovar Typhimurium]|uniref:O-antigen ligase RfaL n=1 Tax=Salmonella typhimurium TaxID=90371 RepID=A0A6Y4BZE8_SALTM|nr:O-antigen ligase RfaL [Salmonella enterica]EAZ9397157.1 O-antigen ligase RfaL [Salmonella enterica subsp. enterica serovar Typhimurium]EBY2708776.1 O-antigen ligase RfaL [Salmonella enterica subsp. enterica serovar Typhimurium]EED3597485.1 O-antigen ligase RfaL [Salmonella enterica subsp. enterica serovar Typhimurium]MLY85590.1 O-antigen ligase RfaL [Salmonella enterica subsp. enterica serovar Typhimurium]TAB28885.1 O-antigen ligase RfaL [Salmonella enterica subsp. enterica serovar Typhimur
MLTTSLTLNKEKWKPIWNKALVFLFVATYFLDGITRYKHLIIILMVITAIYQVSRSPKSFPPLFKNSVFYSVAVLSLILVYSILIAPDMKESFKEFENTVLEGFLLYTLLIPVLLKDETKETVAKIVLFSFLTSLGLRCLAESILYIEDYNKGIMPFISYAHRHMSDSMVFLFPALLNIWLFRKNAIKLVFLVLSAIYLFFILGTLSRGAWLAVLIVGVLWAILNRQWKLIGVGAILLAIIGALVITQHNNKPDPEHLLYKLQQTDSSYRYTNGTQGTAWILIQENPIKGYGYGNDVYDGVYNKRVVDYPTWTFKESIGPHNTILYIWFSAGILGLASLVYLYGAIIRETASSTLRKVEISPYNAHLLLFLSFVGFYIVRGNFEQVDIAQIGIITGFLLALRNR